MKLGACAHSVLAAPEDGRTPGAPPSREALWRRAWTERAGSVLLRYCYGIAPMWVAQLTDFEQLAMTAWRPSGTLPFLKTSFSETRNQLYYSMLRRIAGYGCFTAGFQGARRTRGIQRCLSFKGREGEPLARCWRPPDMHKPQRGQARAVNVALPRHSFAFCLVLKSQGSRPRGPFHFTRTAPRIASSPYAPAGNKFLPFTSGASEENHRWTQMNTDSEGETPRVLLLALGRCPANEFTPWKSAVLSSSYLCLSVSICGCIELFRLRQAEPGDLRC